MKSQVREKAQTETGTFAEEEIQTIGKGQGADEERKVKFDITKCNACGDCLEVCPEDALSIYHKDFVIQEECNGCGQCVKVCDKDALKFVDEDE